MRSHQVLLLLILSWLPLALLRPPTRQQELRVLITARNMVERGDWMHFEFQNRPRYRKPPLPYWIAATGYQIFGRTNQTWPARIPFLLVSLGGAACLLSLAGVKGNETLLLLAMSGGMLWYAPLAETDMPQLAGMIAAVWGWQRKSGTAAGLGMAFALMSKGPGGALIPLITMALMSFREKRSIRFWLPAVLLPLVTAGAWITFLRLDPVAREALERELTATFLKSEHRNSVFFYLYTLPLLLLPGAICIFRKPESPAPLLPRLWLGVGFVLLTLTVSKQQHYTMMLIPPAAWWLAHRIPSPLPTLLRFRVLAPALLLFSLSMGWAYARMSEDGRHSQFLHAAAQDIPADGTLHVVGINSARFDFHLGRHVENIDSAQAALNRAHSGDTVVIVQKRKHWDAEAHPLSPQLSSDDSEWVRRVYRKP